MEYLSSESLGVLSMSLCIALGGVRSCKFCFTEQSFIHLLFNAQDSKVYRVSQPHPALIFFSVTLDPKNRHWGKHLLSTPRHILFQFLPPLPVCTKPPEKEGFLRQQNLSSGFFHVFVYMYHISITGPFFLRRF